MISREICKQSIQRLATRVSVSSKAWMWRPITSCRRRTSANLRLLLVTTTSLPGRFRPVRACPSTTSSATITTAPFRWRPGPFPGTRALSAREWEYKLGPGILDFVAQVNYIGSFLDDPGFFHSLVTSRPKPAGRATSMEVQSAGDGAGRRSICRRATSLSGRRWKRLSLATPRRGRTSRVR